MQRFCGRMLAALLILTPPAVEAQSLRVRAAGVWTEFWRFDAAPTLWSAPDARVGDAVQWKPTATAGVTWGEATVSGDGEAWRIRLIAVRIDPVRVRIRTVTGARPRPDLFGARWTLSQAPPNAVVAFNAGQFDQDGPWGWLVREGVERRVPGGGPLAMAFAMDVAGRPHFLLPDSLVLMRKSGRVLEGFQSWPLLLHADGQVPSALRDSTQGVHLKHRDARLALGQLRDGQLLVVLTRFEGAGGLLEMVPFGLTTPEMAAIMGALGCREAMLLDGGVSSQLALRLPGGARKQWRGLRSVPMGLVAEPRR